jgi:ABC-type glycerol-3-phosphate transport system permease component
VAVAGRLAAVPRPSAAPRPATARLRHRLEEVAVYALLAFAGLVALLPLVWMLLTSLKSSQEIAQFPPTVLPETWVWGNYAEALAAAPFGRFFLNSAVVAGAATLGVLLTSSLAGYAFSHIAFRGRGAVFGLLVATLAIPNEVTIIPAYLVMRTLGWVDTYAALIVPSLASVFGVFLLRQAFAATPRDLLEAAQLDGCGHLRYLLEVVLPLNRAALASLALLTFLGQWNAYLWPLLVTTSEELRTVQIGLRYFADPDLGVDWGPLMAASTLVVAPTLVVFLVAQKHLVEGFATAGLKG